MAKLSLSIATKHLELVDHRQVFLDLLFISKILYSKIEHAISETKAEL